MTQEHREMSQAEFETALDTFGPDIARWPMASRALATNLLATDAKARRLMDESKALISLLTAATSLPPSRRAMLADRITAEAQRTPRIVATGPRPLSSEHRTTTLRTGLNGLTSSAARHAALLAASLLFGVLVGQSQLAVGAFSVIEDVTGIVFDQQTTLAQAIGEEWDED